MSAIKNCTVLVWNSLIDSYHADVESANERAAIIAKCWENHVDCGSEFPKPRLEVMSATQYIKSKFATDF